MKLIKIDGYYIVVSDEIQVKGDKILHKIQRKEGIEICPDNYHSTQEHWLKLIASQNPEHNLPSITFSDEVAKELGIVNMAGIRYPIYNTPMSCYNDEDNSLKQEGYNQCLSDNKEKLFTLEDMRNLATEAAQYGMWYSLNSQHNGEVPKGNTLQWLSNQSLTKTEWDVEVEMDMIPADQAPNGWDIFPKITNNSINVIKLLK